MAFGWFKRNRTAPVETPVAAVIEPAAATLAAEPPAAPRPAPAPVVFPPEKIAARAYEIWIRRGKPAHAELQNWLDAEVELRAEHAANPEPTAPIRKPR